MPHRQRGQVRDPNAGISVITPQASPVDTFQPGAAQRPNPNSGLAGLAQGLSSLVPGLEGLTQLRRGEQQLEDEAANEEAAAEGRALFNQNRVELARAVREGTIPAGANPHLQYAYRVAELKARGMQFGQELGQAWTQSEARNSNDPEAFQDFIRQQTEALYESLGDDYSASELNDGLDPEYQRALSVLQSQHTAYRINANEQRALSSAGALVGSIVQGFAAQPVDPTSDEGGRIRGLASTVISEEATNLIRTGIGGRVVNRVLVDSLISQAEALGRTDILGLADNIRTGSGVISGIPEHLSRLQAARQRIEQRQRATESYERSRVDRERSEAGDRIIGASMSRALETGGDPNDPAFREAQTIVAQLVEEGTLAPSVLTGMNAFQRRLNSDTTSITEDPEDIVALYDQLGRTDTNNGMALILGLAEQERLTPSGVRSAIAYLEGRREASGLFDSDIYREATSAIRGVVVTPTYQNPSGTQRQRVRANNAARDLDGRIIRWASENPELATDVSRGGAFYQFLGTAQGDILNDPRYDIGQDARVTNQSFAEPVVVGGNDPTPAPAPAPGAEPTPAPPPAPPVLTPEPVIGAPEGEPAEIAPEFNPTAGVATEADIRRIGTAQTRDELLQIGLQLQARHLGNDAAWAADPILILLFDRQNQIFTLEQNQ